MVDRIEPQNLIAIWVCMGVFGTHVIVCHRASSLESSRMDGKWETVKTKQRSTRPANPALDRQHGTASGNGVFAAIDANWKPGTFARSPCATDRSADTLVASPECHTMHYAGRRANVYVDDDADGPSVSGQQEESDASTATHANGHINGVKAPPKPKQPKAKPPKRSTPMQAAQALDAAQLQKVCDRFAPVSCCDALPSSALLLGRPTDFASLQIHLFPGPTAVAVS